MHSLSASKQSPLLRRRQTRFFNSSCIMYTHARPHASAALLHHHHCTCATPMNAAPPITGCFTSRPPLLRLRCCRPDCRLTIPVRHGTGRRLKCTACVVLQIPGNSASGRTEGQQPHKATGLASSSRYTNTRPQGGRHTSIAPAPCPWTLQVAAGGGGDVMCAPEASCDGRREGMGAVHSRTQAHACTCASHWHMQE